MTLRSKEGRAKILFEIVRGPITIIGLKTQKVVSAVAQ